MSTTLDSEVLENPHLARHDLAPGVVAEGAALAPSEAITFFRQKVPVPTRKWGEVSSEGYARSFAVAGAASQALVTDFQAAVNKALAQGTTLADFRKQFDRLVKKYGWDYHGSRNWRSALIYDTNLSAAYAAGRYRQMTTPEALELYPLWRYRHNACLHPRLEHVAWDGTILPANHPWWDTHYPPNGWKCHCSVEVVSDGKMARQGWQVSEAPPLDAKPWTNPATGAVVMVPKGIDPGFQTNVGQQWLKAEKQRAKKALHPVDDVRGQPLAGLPAPEHQEIERQQVRDLASMEEPSGSDDVPPLPFAVGTVRCGTLAGRAQAILQSTTASVLLSGESLNKNRLHHPELTVEDYESLPEILAQPSHLILKSKPPEHETTRSLTLLGRWRDRLYSLAIKTTLDREENYAVSLTRLAEKDWARLLRKEIKDE
ncbi:hypothetical protein E3E12_06060 [Formicincola oecophyllae]|uniref:Phage head morphogenesis domain-containing protein n=1 Tax=Formicincola oecophyllae TaxID=2558361 RepID=A0A4Y6UA34_9PROT|nr:phage minor head protein [Formicincola oecophyllae]QDH13820.1 hypothetical protein E3E12_06060 [Formicincola oecophyllae]